MNGEDVKDGWSRFPTGAEFRGGICSLVGKLVRSADLLLAKWSVTISDTVDAICLLESRSIWKILSDSYIFRSGESALLELKWF